MSQINNSRQAFATLKTQYNPFSEEFWLISLNTQLQIINVSLIAKGTLNFCLVHPRDLFRQALSDNAFTLIIAHNHPSQNTQPTFEDLKLTKRLVKISKLIEIPIIDHIIFTRDDFFSFKQNSLLD